MLVRVLLKLLAVVAAGFVFVWVRSFAAERAAGRLRLPNLLETSIGFVTNFFDTLGIGSFAPTTTAFRLWKLTPDENIPGTLNVGHTPPVVVQAFIYVSAVMVEPVTLVTLIASAILGSWLGAGVVRRWPRRRIQLGMGIGLLFAGTMMVLKNLDEMRGVPLFPGGTAVGLDGGVLLLAAALNFVFGAIVTLGIGSYAPSLITISLLGMNPLTAWPIMMGSCAFLMPVAGARFVTARRYEPGPALGLALGGIPAVLIAAYLVRSLPLVAVRWLVVVVVLYAAWGLLRSARSTISGSASAAS